MEVTTMTEQIQLARLLQLCSPALPVGAYAYSQGLESAIHDHFVTDKTSAAAWIRGIFEDSFAQLDLPAMLRAASAWRVNDAATISSLDVYLAASRETSELLLEDKDMGRSLVRLLKSLDVVLPEMTNPSFATVFGCAGAVWGIQDEALATGFCFCFVENQVAAATKTVPLGQTVSQQMLASLAVEIEPAVKQAGQVAGELAQQEPRQWSFGQSLPALAILSSRHETLEARLYRS